VKLKFNNSQILIKENQLSKTTPVCEEQGPEGLKYVNFTTSALCHTKIIPKVAYFAVLALLMLVEWQRDYSSTLYHRLIK
jgi:hypothetical protein